MATLQVNADGSAEYTTIQAAIDAAGEGDAIFVANGTYVEQVTVSKNGLTITGESQLGVIVRSPAAPTQQDPGFAAVIAVLDATGVTIGSLSVDGDRRADEAFVGGAQDFFGILYIRSSGTVSEVNVADVQGDNGFFGVQAGQGIGVLADSPVRQSFTLVDSTITGFQKTGLLTSGIDLTANGNTITGIGQTTLIGQNGIQLGGDTRGTVADNTVSGIGYDGSATDQFDASAIIVLDTTADLSITGNTLTGSVSTDDTAVFLYDNVGVTVSGNTMSDFGVGIDVEDEPFAFADVDPAFPNVSAPNTFDNVGVNLIFDPESDDFNPTPTPRTDAFTVVGTSGTDDLRGSGGNDSLSGAGGADTLTGRSGDDVLSGGGDDDLLLGGVGSDTLRGDGGDDTLDGAGGSDSAEGGLGNDFYVVQSGDVAFERANEGDDTVESSDSYVLARGSSIETLLLVGTAVRGTGNAFANTLLGNELNNRLGGSAGADTIDGGTGRDVMVGGTGNDVFRFDALSDSSDRARSSDIIVDFNAADDRIDIGAIATGDSDAAFQFIGMDQFSAVGQVRYFFDAGRTIVQLNTVSGEAPELVIRLNGTLDLEADNFLL